MTTIATNPVSAQSNEAASQATPCVLALPNLYPRYLSLIAEERAERRPDLMRVREALKSHKSLKHSQSSPDRRGAALHVLYNLVRSVNPRMGFQPHRPESPIYPRFNTGFNQAASRVKKLADSLGITWLPVYSMLLDDARRAALLEDYAESCRVGNPALEALRRATYCTPHGPNSSAMEHGLDCWKIYYGITETIRRKRIESEGSDWPQWLKQYGVELLARQQIQAFVMHNYLAFHDCGKAATLQRDAKLRLHYPGHAKASADLWRMGFGADSVEAKLMEQDMVLHTAPVEDMDAFSRNPLSPSLLLATYAQLRSNAVSIFGGFESKSYLTKLAALNERAEALLGHWGLKQA